MITQVEIMNPFWVGVWFTLGAFIVSAIGAVVMLVIVGIIKAIVMLITKD